MRKFESEKTELKQKFTDGLYKEIVAFANTDGGTIYIGVDDDGNSVGLENVDQEYVKITNGIRDAIRPDVTMFIRYILEDEAVIRIEVSEGTNKPYYLQSKGIKPTGVFVRQGASSAPATSEQIRKMIKESDGDVYEEMRSPIQDLTFCDAERFFTEAGVEFSKEKYNMLGVTNAKDGMYTNLGLLLSDQCQHSIKFAFFADDDNTVFRDKREVTGSILHQLEEALNFIDMYNRKAAQFQGIKRIEVRDYPEYAIREALLNSIIHRDYSYSGSILIKANKSSIEFITLGGLMPGLSVEDIKLGISQSRNQKLAAIFHRLNFVEAYGTGIQRIFSVYRSYDLKPDIEVSPHAFKFILPNVNENVIDEMMKSK